jgi:hypothetical protein
MSSKAMSLKARIRNLAKSKNISAQSLLQNFMMISDSLELREMWQKYQRGFNYAQSITWEKVIESLVRICDTIQV